MAQGVVLPVQEIPESGAGADPASSATAVQDIFMHDHPVWHEFIKAVATKPEHVFMWFMLISLLLVWVLLLWSWHRSKENKINLEDLIMADGKINESKMNRFVAFVISSWGFIFLLVTGQFTDWYFMGYMAAWVSNALFSTYLRQRDKELDQNYKLEMRREGIDEANDSEDTQSDTTETGDGK